MFKFSSISFWASLKAMLISWLVGVVVWSVIMVVDGHFDFSIFGLTLVFCLAAWLIFVVPPLSFINNVFIVGQRKTLLPFAMAAYAFFVMLILFGAMTMSLEALAAVFLGLWAVPYGAAWGIAYLYMYKG